MILLTLLSPSLSSPTVVINLNLESEHIVSEDAGTIEICADLDGDCPIQPSFAIPITAKDVSASTYQVCMCVKLPFVSLQLGVRTINLKIRSLFLDLVRK